MKKTFTTLAALTLMASLAPASHAADFPAKDRPVTIVVPFPAGGPTDRVARDLAEAMRKPLGANILVENTGGAGGSIGANKVAKAAADGHTLLLHHIGMATMPTMYRKLAFNVEKDFEFLGVFNEVPMALVSKPGLPANNYKELLGWMTQNKSKVNMGHSGVGSASHLCGLLLQSSLGFNMTTVPYKGTGPAMTDLLGGQIDVMCDQTTNTTGQIEAKKIKAFAVTSGKRLSTPALKDLPTLTEAGMKNVEVTVWNALYAPKGTPADVQKKINDALKVAMKDPDFIKKQEGLGAVLVTDKRVEIPEHKKFVSAEIARWAPIIKAAEVYAD